MLKSKTLPFEEDIEKATNENNAGEDWSLIMHICDNAINYQDGAKFCLKAIMKRLHHNVPRVVLSTLIVLDACVKNCDRRFLLQVASSEFTNEVRKLLAKMHPTTATELKSMLQRWSLEEFKDDAELCIIPSLYYKLKSEGMEFPSMEKDKPTTKLCTNPDAVTSEEEESDIIKALLISIKDTGRYAPPPDNNISDSNQSKTVPEPFKVRALYDFDAAEDNELTIKIGEIVLVLDNSDAGWWKGSNHRGEGLFPANFVTEDLEHKADEAEESNEVNTASEDIAFTGDVKLDEKKIEDVLNWLSDVDPTEEPSDPADMLRLESEVYQMSSLIEENLQAIDNRLVKLSNVNVKIMEAFDLFHSLSTSQSPYLSYKYMPMQNTTMSMTGQPQQDPQLLMNQPMMYLPTMQPAPFQIPAAKATATELQVSENGAVESNSTGSPTFPTAANSSQVSSGGQGGLAPMVVHPYNAGSIPGGRLYVPQQMQLPVLSNLPYQGYIQGAGPGNVMGMPFPVTGLTQYIPFPYHGVNRDPSTASMQMNMPETISQNDQPTATMPATKADTSAPSNTFPVYPSDLQQVDYSQTAAHIHSARQEGLHDSGTLSANETHGAENMPMGL